MADQQTFVIVGTGLASAKTAEALRGEGFAGRVPVDERLQPSGHPEAFATGDFAVVDGLAPDAVPPMLAPAAIQSGRHAGQQVAGAINGRPTILG